MHGSTSTPTHLNECDGLIYRLRANLISCVVTSTLFLTSGCQPQNTETSVNQVWFHEEATQRGITYHHQSGFKDRPYLPEITGGGVALIDVDADNDLDLYFIQSGWHLADPEGSDSLSALPNELFINDGLANFSKAQNAGEIGNTGYGMGATVGDYDNDGDPDIYVTNYGDNALLQNDGKGRFKDVTLEAGLSEPSWSTASTFIDIDTDGDLDLFVVNYLHWQVATELDCYSRGVLTYCLPTNYQAPAMDSLYENNGDGTFTEITVQSGIHKAFGNGLGVVAADFNGDARPDLFVANDTMVNQLWINEGNNQFTDRAFEWGCAVDNHGIEKAGMGVDTADIDNDLDFDVLVVNFEGQTDSVFMNQNTYFRDETSRLGLGSGTRQFTRFGIALADFDNDGLLDLMEANGKVDGDPTNPVDEFAEPNSLYKGTSTGAGFKFVGIATSDGTADPLKHTSRALAVGDLNRDGRLDAVVVNRDAEPYLLINETEPSANWIRFRVMNGHGSHAIGATVSLTVGETRRISTVKVSASYLSAFDPVVHFGLGNEEEALGVVVRWPTGEVRELGNLTSNQTISVASDS